MGFCLGDREHGERLKRFEMTKNERIGPLQIRLAESNRTEIRRVCPFLSAYTTVTIARFAKNVLRK